jgi:hypothetical protein
LECFEQTHAEPAECFHAISTSQNLAASGRESALANNNMAIMQKIITVVLGLLISFLALESQAQVAGSPNQQMTVPRHPQIDHRADHAPQRLNGLEISLKQEMVTRPLAPKFEITFQNESESPLTLLLGMVFGGTHYPTSVHLVLIGPEGELLPLDSAGPSYIVGRVDPMLSFLPAHALFVLPVDLQDYVSPTTNVRRLHLAPGHYRLSAWYEGLAGPVFPNACTCWTGILKSNELAFDLTEVLDGRLYR